MAAIHEQPKHPWNLVGALVKGVRPPKGSINIPRPRDPCWQPRPLPQTPPVSDNETIRTKSRLNKAKLFSLSGSDSEVVIKKDRKILKPILAKSKQTYLKSSYYIVKFLFKHAGGLIRTSATKKFKTADSWKKTPWTPPRHEVQNLKRVALDEIWRNPLSTKKVTLFHPKVYFSQNHPLSPKSSTFYPEN